MPCLTAAAKEAGNIQMMMAINVAKCNTTTMPRGQIIFIQPCNDGVFQKFAFTCPNLTPSVATDRSLRVEGVIRILKFKEYS